jgi:hypothetical protein
MNELTNISTYLKQYGAALGQRVVEQFPPLHQPSDPVWPALDQLKRRPFPAQTLAIMGIVKRWEEARCAAAVAECGTGKTLISLGSVFTHARGRRFTALAMVPPMLLHKWAREILLTLPGVRVFFIDGLRNGVSSNGFTGVNEVKYRAGHIVREGLRTTLSDLRQAKYHRSARARWDATIGAPSIMVASRERMKLGYFWRHAYGTPRSGPFLGCVVNPDTGKPVLTADDQLRRSDFRKSKHSELVLPDCPKGRRPMHSALWQADNEKIARMAPIEFIGRHLGPFFDYGIADEVHELKGSDTAQGNALGTLASACDRTVILTGTLLGGYADDLFNILHRVDPKRMREEGFDHGEVGVRQFASVYGVLEKVTTIEAADNACSKAKVTTTVKRRPGASPLLFGSFLMNMAAFVSLEDISDALPPFQEEVISVPMDPALKQAYGRLEDDVREALRQHHGNASVVSTGMNALLLYPDRPFGLGTLYGFDRDPETGDRERFVISEPADLAEDIAYAKERRLIQDAKVELSAGRNLHVFAVYTRKRDVTRRLRDLFEKEGIRAEILTSDVPPADREAWYDRQLRNGMRVCIAHPKLCSVGLDLLEFPSLYFYQTGYSLYTLRQASRRSWRIGQRQPVRVVYMTYAESAQEACLRLMGKKLMASLPLEGKLHADGLQAMDSDDDLLTAMARELVTRQGVGEAASEIWKTLAVRHGGPPVQPKAVVEPPTEISSWAPPTGPAVQLSLF